MERRWRHSVAPVLSNDTTGTLLHADRDAAALVIHGHASRRIGPTAIGVHWIAGSASWPRERPRRPTVTGGRRKQPKAVVRLEGHSTGVRSQQADSRTRSDHVDDLDLTDADCAFLDYIAAEAVRLYLARTSHKR
jgi:hypothetical protein